MNQLIKHIGILNLFLSGVWLAYPDFGFWIMAGFSLVLIAISQVQAKTEFNFISRWIKNSEYQGTRIGFINDNRRC